MKKARKGMLLSLLSLVFALAITATSTYAWFVVNREVTASNMQVTVKADTRYLVIKAADSLPANVDALGTETSATLSASDAEVLPVMYDQAESGVGVIKWKTGTGQAYNNGAATLDDNDDPIYTSISSADVTAGKYFVKYTFYVGLTSTSALPATNLRVKTMTVTANSTANNADTFAPAVSVVVNCGSVWIDYENIDSIDAAGYLGAGYLSAEVARNTVYQIDAYVYINGDNEVVKNANAAKLGGFKLAMTLECSD